MPSNYTFRDRSDEALSEAKGQVGGWLTGLLERAVVLARRHPPVGSPRLTGNNARSINFSPQAGVDDPLPTMQEGAFYFFTSSKYGGWLEIGTSKMPARPYMEPALTQARRQAEQRGVPSS